MTGPCFAERFAEHGPSRSCLAISFRSPFRDGHAVPISNATAFEPGEHQRGKVSTRGRGIEDVLTRTTDMSIGGLIAKLKTLDPSSSNLHGLGTEFEDAIVKHIAQEEGCILVLATSQLDGCIGIRMGNATRTRKRLVEGNPLEECQHDVFCVGPH